MSDIARELKTALEKGETTLLEQWDEVKSYLRGAGFPMTKSALLEQAKSLRAPEAVQDFVTKLADRTYETLEDVFQAAKDTIHRK